MPQLIGARSRIPCNLAKTSRFHLCSFLSLQTCNNAFHHSLLFDQS